MVTTLTLADALGRRKIAEAVGVGATAVSNAVVRGRFPASWFLIIKRLADEAGQECPPALFNLRADDTQKVGQKQRAAATPTRGIA